jgi:CheY-specific phosphatase CheX
MTSITHSPLLAAAATTFESLAMLPSSASLSAVEAAAPIAFGVRVDFEGPLRGRLELRVTADVACCVAENMLGLPIALDTDATLVRDALGEVANVVCGNVLPELAGRDAVFHLSAPYVCGAPDGTPNDFALSLGVDGGRADLTLHLVHPHTASRGAAS